MERILTVVGLLLGLPLSVAACLWDRDTPGDEAKGLPDIVAILSGRFARNPPLFYEMRLERVTAELHSHPGDLAAYDDAGVACDRLGRGDEAIDWMEKKRAQLEQFEVKEHRYRYHANLGTFLVHRWFRQGADRTKIDQVKKARDQIAKALEINPNAHFGREKYQLHVLEWIIDPPKAAGLHHLPNLVGWEPSSEIHLADPKLADQAVRGLAGLIGLGNAWESVDVFHALNIALQHDTLGFENDVTGGRNSLAYFAWLRCRELIDAGNGSMLPDAPEGEDLKGLLPGPSLVTSEEQRRTTFSTLRDDADDWQKARASFMNGRLKEGRHPDTNRDFWTGYSDSPAPVLGTTPVAKDETERPFTTERLVQGAMIGVLVLEIAWLVGRRVRSGRNKRGETREEEVLNGF